MQTEECEAMRYILREAAWLKPEPFPLPLRFVKRCFDIAVSLSALLLLSPFLAAAALVVRRDGGPAVYRQERLTRGGERFTILKFRTMRPEQPGDSFLYDSSRVTPIGTVLRKYHLDELPQLVNILRGEMSLVGPRPERPELVAEYERELPEFALRLRVKAGLTGYAQVHGAYDTPPRQKLALDLWYMTHPGILTDLRILWDTAVVIWNLMIEERKRFPGKETDADAKDWD